MLLRPPPRRRTTPPVGITRRAGMAATAAAATLVAGCTGDGDDRPTDGVLTPTAPPADADDELVDRVVARIAQTRDEVAALGREVRAVRDQARSLTRLHEAHGRELGGLPDRAAPRGGRPGAGSGRPTDDAARARIRRAEDELGETLVDAAVDARSGALAQLFASMSAALAQRTAT